MYMVYWTEEAEGAAVPRSKLFSSEQLVAVMNFTEALRTRQRGGELISFITMCSENPNSVGRAGVAETGADYQWKKRRP